MRLRALATFTCLSVALSLAAQSPQPTSTQPDYASNPKFVDALKEAKLLQKQKRYFFSEDAYKKANKIAGGDCLECMRGIYDTEFMQGDFKGAIATATQLIPLAKAPSTKSLFQYDLGEALAAKAGAKAKPDQLEPAHEAFQQSLSSYPKNAAAYFADGRVLAKQGKLTEASDSFRKCLDYCSPNDPSRLRAQHFAENPELSLHKMAPSFEVTALDGSKFNLDAMGGRVVLIDFWATWCGPCNRELPHMKSIAKEFAGQPLVIISVSWDSDETKWKEFIRKNDMTWAQYRDADHNLANLFEINAIPHYFTIDSDGVLTSEMLGEDQDVEGKLKKLLAKAKAASTSVQKVSTVDAGTNTNAGQVALVRPPL